MPVQLKLNYKSLKLCKSPWWCSGCQRIALPGSVYVSLRSLLALLCSATQPGCGCPPCRGWHKQGFHRFPHRSLIHSVGVLFLLYSFASSLTRVPFVISIQPRGIQSMLQLSAQAISLQERAGQANLKQKETKNE